MIGAAPAARDRPMAKIDEVQCWRREVPGPGREGNRDPALAEADDVGAAVAVHVRNLAEKLIVAAPSACAGTMAEIVDFESWRREVSAATRERNENAVLAEGNDIGQT